jgi:hypothetical protein
MQSTNIYLYVYFFIPMSILILILLCILFSSISHLWFNTDFFPFYVKLFKPLCPKKIYSWLLIQEYFNRPVNEMNYSSYIEYLSEKKQFSKNFTIVFLLKIFSCQLCLGMWLSIFSVLLSASSLLFIGFAFVLIRATDSVLNYFLKIH